MSIQYENLKEQYASKSNGYYEISRAEMLPFVPVECARVLEIGCSSGGFGKLIKDRGSDTIVWGIEPDKTAADVAATRLDRVINGTFSPSLPEIAGKTFDCIVFNDVLEHLVDPAQILDQCKQFLT